MLEWMRFLAWGMTLHQAAQFDRPDRIRKLLSRGADVNAPDGKGITPLFYTANKGGIEAAELLLAAGADIDASVPGGGTPLHSALLKRHAKLALFFIERGADVRKATIVDVNPLHMALEKRRSGAYRRERCPTRLLGKGCGISAARSVPRAHETTKRRRPSL
jgi:ankyrin repeat protein